MQRAARRIVCAELAGRRPAGTITLDRASRYRRRLVLTSDQGLEFLLDLPEALHLAHGDALELEDGRLIEVHAAAEPLLKIYTDDAATLTRIAWHIGNRHTPAEVTRNALYIQPDHVLEAMVIGLGAHVEHVRRSFDPEGGAYGGKGPLEAGHHHGHAYGHGHSHGHPPAIAPTEAGLAARRFSPGSE